MVADRGRRVELPPTHLRVRGAVSSAAAGRRAVVVGGVFRPARQVSLGLCLVSASSWLHRWRRRDRRALAPLLGRFRALRYQNGIRSHSLEQVPCQPRGRILRLGETRILLGANRGDLNAALGTTCRHNAFDALGMVLALGRLGRGLSIDRRVGMVLALARESIDTGTAHKYFIPSQLFS